MNKKYLFFVIVIVIIFIILLLNKHSFEEFSEYKMSAEQTDDLSKLKVDGENNNIFVGKEGSQRIYPDLNLATNNTIFIKDGIEMKNDRGENVYLDMKTIKDIKYLPYNFKDKFCIGNSCVNKTHIKMLKGDIPFKMNSFYKTSPYQLYGGSGYGKIKTTIGVLYGIPSISFPVHSIRITEPGYNIIIYSEPGYKGQSTTIKESTPHIAGIVIDGGRPFAGGAKSLIPLLESGKEHAKNACLSLERPAQRPWNRFLYQGKDCNNPLVPGGNEFYILRPDLFAPHGHDKEPDVHFHDHPKEHIIHGGSSE
jgi:hypothetical protein